MKYLIAILLPPLAVLMCGKFFQFFLSIIFTICFWVPGIIHALFVVSSYEADKRNQKVIQAIREGQR